MKPEDAVRKVIEEMSEHNLFPKIYTNQMIMYAYMLVGIGFDIGRHSVTRDKPVIKYDKFGNLLEFYISTMDAERDTKVNHQNIAACCNGHRNNAGGYIWKYINNEQK